jgi:hypothetical protein
VLQVEAGHLAVDPDKSVGHEGSAYSRPRSVLLQ